MYTTYTYLYTLNIHVYIGTGAKAYISVTKLYAQRKEARDKTHADLKALVMRFAQGILILVYNIYMTYYTPLIYTYKTQIRILYQCTIQMRACICSIIYCKLYHAPLNFHI